MRTSDDKIIIEALTFPLRPKGQYYLYDLLEELFRGQVTPEDLNQFVADYALVSRRHTVHVTGEQFEKLWKHDPFRWRLYLANKRRGCEHIQESMQTIDEAFIRNYWPKDAELYRLIRTSLEQAHPQQRPALTAVILECLKLIFDRGRRT